METLTTLLEKVKESSLNKSDLEELYSAFLNLFSSVELRLSEVEKQGALFLDAHKEESVAAGKRAWRATALGQEEIGLKHQSTILEKQLSATKHRIYSYIAY